MNDTDVKVCPVASNDDWDAFNACVNIGVCLSQCKQIEDAIEAIDLARAIRNAGKIREIRETLDLICSTIGAINGN